MTSGGETAFQRRWLLWLFLLWMLAAGALIWSKWSAITWFALGDTDDNMRLMQVRALLSGQDWFDLRQYRLDPPRGADIHWSRLVDLPIAGLILGLRPILGGLLAEKLAVAIAPLIPLYVSFAGLGLTARRLIGRGAWIVAAAIMLCSYTLLLMFMPLRIDHHGWQLALLTINIAGLADPKPGRGGATVGVASALSLAIGLEMLPWLAISGAAVALRWVLDQREALRLRAYGLALAGGTGAMFLGFASYANRVARCDALTPVWLSTMVLAGAAVFVASLVRSGKWPVRLGISALAGSAALAFFALAWPDCLGRPEQVSPELQRLWLDNISEAKPLFRQNIHTILSVSVLLIGVAGNLREVWRRWRTPEGAAWAAIALLSVGSGLMLLWQTRVGAAAILFSIPGATALGWSVLPGLRASPNVLVRTFGVVAAFLAVSGLWAQLAIALIPNPQTATPGMKLVNKANATCPTSPALLPIAKLPKATIFAPIDITPRLITMTHHNAISGPYHRNGAAILDVQHAFRGSADAAREIMLRHGATMLLICPHMSETTIWRAQNPKGFYMQLERGQVPDWLTPVPLPANSPFRLWRISPLTPSNASANWPARK